MAALGTLALIDSGVTLALQIGSVLVPLIKGAISSIKQDLSPQGTVVYTVVISTDQAELVDTATVSITDLVAINKELQAQNVIPLVVPTPPAAPTQGPPPTP